MTVIRERTDVTCPECNSDNITYSEKWSNVTKEYLQKRGWLSEHGTAVECKSEGLFGRCKECNHTWKFKNAEQIPDILDGHTSIMKGVFKKKVAEDVWRRGLKPTEDYVFFKSEWDHTMDFGRVLELPSKYDRSNVTIIKKTGWKDFNPIRVPVRNCIWRPDVFMVFPLHALGVADTYTYVFSRDKDCPLIVTELVSERFVSIHENTEHKEELFSFLARLVELCDRGDKHNESIKNTFQTLYLNLPVGSSGYVQEVELTSMQRLCSPGSMLQISNIIPDIYGSMRNFYDLLTAQEALNAL